MQRLRNRSPRQTPEQAYLGTTSPRNSEGFMSKRIRIAAVIAAGAAVIAAAPALGATTTVNIKTTSGFMFTGMPSTLKAGTYKFVYTNTSGIRHNLEVGSTHTPTFGKGSKSITVTLKKGTVKYECMVPGHAAAGMKGTITVK